MSLRATMVREGMALRSTGLRSSLAAAPGRVTREPLVLRSLTTSTRHQRAQPVHTPLLKLIGLASAAAAFGAGLHLSTAGPLRLDAPQSTSPLSSAAQTDDAFRIDPATSQPFPTTLPAPQTPTGAKDLRLVGLGVRTVSFLRVRVYVAGLYVDAAALGDLQSTPGWRDFEASWMLGGAGSSNDGTERRGSEALLNALLDRGITCAIRIVPVRSTDFAHLRDGFTRSIQGRAKLARKSSLLSAETDEALSHALQSLKEAFPKASLPKGNALDLIFTPASTPQGFDLTLEEGGKVLGAVKSLPGGPEAGRFSVARQLLLAYFADKDEISKPVSA